MLENTNVQEINQAIVVLRKLNADEKMRYLADMREMALHDEASAMLGSREEGIEIGRIEGRAEIISKMRKKGMSDEMIDEILNS